ncbi:MAG: hypothetical protein P4L57_07775 [Rhizomicrobium sp.]|nr:hypothetical protein [Rhizomicrobium sp.]
MLSTDKINLLQSFLGSLPGDLAARLAQAIEVDRLVDGKALPHQLILDGLRPVLRISDAARRTPTPLRMFCRPFEDLLVNLPRTEKQRGRILRSHVVPVWQWLSKHLLVQETQNYSDDVRNAVVASKLTAALARAEQFWPLAGNAMLAALTADRKRAVMLLGGESIAADVTDIALVLQSGSAMLAVQALLPKPTPSLNEELLWGLRGLFDSVAEHNPDAAPLVSVVAMRRLAKPWEALKLAMLIARQSHDVLISSTDMGLAGDVLFADMEDSRDVILGLRHPVFDENVLIANLAAFTNISSAIVKEVEILRTGRWGQRLLKDRAAVGATMETFMERAPKEIAGALPTHKAGYSGGPRVPDFSKPIDPDRTARALRYARVMARTKNLSVAGSFGAKHQNAMDDITLMVRSYCEDLLKELRTAEGPRREVVESQFQLSLELTTLLFDGTEAEFLLRRGKAAGAKVAA